MQPSEKFHESVQYLIEQLRCSQLPTSQWSEVVGQQLDIPLVNDAVQRIVRQFPHEGDVAKKFDLTQIARELEQRLTGERTDGVVVSAGQSRAVGLQLDTIMGLQRYAGRRRQSRATRIVNAAHRRATLTHDHGPLVNRLKAAVDNLLANL